jgi:hypothetical protein
MSCQDDVIIPMKANMEPRKKALPYQHIEKLLENYNPDSDSVTINDLQKEMDFLWWASLIQYSEQLLTRALSVTFLVGGFGLMLAGMCAGFVPGGQVGSGACIAGGIALMFAGGFLCAVANDLENRYNETSNLHSRIQTAIKADPRLPPKQSTLSWLKSCFWGETSTTNEANNENLKGEEQVSTLEQATNVISITE